MKSFILFFTVLLFFASYCADAQKQYAFRVSFKDKNGTTGNLSAPNTFLSVRAIARRSLQSIVIDSTDLPLSSKYTDSVLFTTNGILHTRSRWQNNCVILVNDTSSMSLLRSYSFIKEVKYIAVFLSPLHYFQGKLPAISDQYSYKSTMRTTGGVGYYGDAYDQIKLANGDYLHDRGFRGKGKVIAVLDEGFNLVNSLPGFDSLRTTGRIIDTYNFNLDTPDVYGYSSHGTQVLSTMAGILNGDYVGTAPDAMYALYVTENGSSEQPFEMDNLVAAMERADSVGADIITISLGYNTFDIGGINASLSLSDIDGKSTIAARGANVATQKGILVIASAGNEGGAAWEKILTPGDADSVLTCGSVAINLIRAPSSGKGPNSAGVRKPDVCMLGAPGIVFNNSGTTSSVGGTSIATPELAGLAACLWQAYPKVKPYELRKSIKESGHIASLPNNEIGYGVPDFGKALSLLIPTIDCNCIGPDIYTFPSPFKEKVTVNVIGSSPQGILHWRLYTIQGVQLMEATQVYNVNEFHFDIAVPVNLPRGIYLLQLMNEQYNKTVKLVKD